MKTTSLRTQITLPKALRQEIDQARQSSGESLSGYLNKAAKERLKREKQETVELEGLAEKIVGSIKENDLGWGSITGNDWREEREEEENYRLKRLNSLPKHTVKRQKQNIQPQRNFILRDK